MTLERVFLQIKSYYVSYNFDPEQEFCRALQVYSSYFLVVLQDKQSIARQGHGLKFPNKSGTGSDGMGLWAGSCFWESESGGEVFSWGGFWTSVVRELEVWTEHCSAARHHLLYHIHHGNIISIFFSLQDQSLFKPSKQQWNNSLFVLCGLSEGGGTEAAFWGPAGSTSPFLSPRSRWKQSFLLV